MKIDYDCECGMVFRTVVAKSGCVPRRCPACCLAVDYDVAATLAAEQERECKRDAALKLRGREE